MTVASDAAALTSAYRRAQVRRAATIAALVAAYYRTKVVVDDPSSVEAWLALWLPRLEREHDTTARQAALFGNKLRTLEVAGAPEFSFEPSVGATPEQIRTSLMVVGPQAFRRKMTQIERIDKVTPTQKRALIAEAKQETATAIAASAVRHVQNGGRQTLIDNALRDRTSLGYVRVTKDKPCFFCAMLASRGKVFEEDSFADSDPRFIGPGNVKVHDSCQCTMKPVYRSDDENMKRAKEFEDLWQTWGAGGGDALTRFRRGYEHWAKTGEKLDWEVVNDLEKFRAR